MKKTDTPSRRAHYDLVRVASMAAVVYLHAAADGLRQGEDALLWQTSNVLTAVCSAAVPLFFMLSGALLLGSERTGEPGYVLRRRLPRVLVPLLCWSGLVLLWMGYTQGTQAALSRLLLLPSLTVLTPYWFLYALIPLYLLSPLLRRMTENLEEVHWRYLLLLWLVLTIGVRTLHSFVPAPWNDFFQSNWVYNVDLVGGYMGYFLLGAWLDRREKLPSQSVLWLTAAADIAVMALGTWWYSAALGAYDERLKDYLGVFTMVLAAVLFLLARSYCARRESGRALTFLAENSFGVYLAHPMAIFCVEHLVAGRLLPGLVSQGVVFLLALVLCLAGSALVGSIPGLGFLFTGRHFREGRERRST